MHFATLITAALAAFPKPTLGNDEENQSSLAELNQLSKDEQIAQLERDLHGPTALNDFEEQADRLLKDWQPTKARWLWRQVLDLKGFVESKAAMALFVKSLEQRDLSLVGDLFCHAKREIYQEFAIRYLTQHRLQHAWHLDEKLKKTVAELNDQQVGIFYDWLMPLLGKLPWDHIRHPSIVCLNWDLSVFKVSLMCLLRALPRDLIMKRIQAPSFRVNLYNFQILAEQLQEHGFEPSHWVTNQSFTVQQVYGLINGPENAELTLNVYRAFALLQGGKVAPKADLSPEMSLMAWTFENRLSWFQENAFKINIFYRLKFIWAYPLIADQIPLPEVKMPPIAMLIPHCKWSFEKAGSLQAIIKQYNVLAIRDAMIAEGHYTPDHFYHLATIADPSIPVNPCEILSLIPAEDEADQLEWWRYFVTRTDPSREYNEGKIAGIPFNQ